MSHKSDTVIRIILITGFTQSGRNLSGLELLYDKLIRRLSDHKFISIVTMHEWDDDMKAIAMRESRMRPDEIMVVGYSYGGSSALRLCRHLQTEGLTVSMLGLVDPVYRRFRSIPALSSFLPWKKLRVPNNVEKVCHFFQRQNYPRGHDLKLDGPTHVSVSTELQLTHAAIDNNSYVHITLLNSIRAVLAAASGMPSSSL